MSHGESSPKTLRFDIRWWCCGVCLGAECIWRTSVGYSSSSFSIGFHRCGERSPSFKPETAVRWHGAGFRCYWRWKSRSRGGRPQISAELRACSRG